MAPSHEISVGILTASDTCSAGAKPDISGKKLLDIISEAKLIPNTKVIHYEIVPDELADIARVLRKWSSEDDCNVILTTGGTGFAKRDVTPEATRDVIEREAPGLMHAITANSLAVTPLAMLSRGVCGIRNNTIIVNLPGSVKAAVECLHFVSPVIPHAVHLLKNSTEIIVETHDQLQAEGPQLQTSMKPSRKSQIAINAVAFRDRQSPYPMVDVRDAFNCIQSVVSVLGTQTIPLSQALGYVLAEDVIAPDALPPFRASIKDGYAVIASDGAGRRTVIDSIAAGHMPAKALAQGACVRINTGAPLPDGADAVVQVEDTELVAANTDGSKELTIEITTVPTVGLDIRPIGCDIAAGSTVLTAGIELRAAELGVLASVGQSTVTVYKKPIIGLLSTGNELQSPEEHLKPGHIRDSNKTTLLALFKQFSYATVDCGITIDEPDKVLEALESAFAKCDILVTTGGVSMGDRDILKQVLKTDFGAQIHFGRVNMKPGKPTTFATCAHKGIVKYIFALPGNPVSATVTTQLFVLRALEKMSNKTMDPPFTIEVGHDFKLDPQRPEYHRATIKWGPTGPVAFGTGNQMSSRLGSMLSAQCLLMLPAQTVDRKLVAAGERVEAMMLKS